MALQMMRKKPVTIITMFHGELIDYHVRIRAIEIINRDTI